MSSSIVLDQVLYGLLMEEELRGFTVLQLRQEYADRVNLNGVGLPRLRVHIPAHGEQPFRRNVNTHSGST